ncbi:MAG: UvrD-helicase domain-containing protein [Bacteroidales bacterium]|nr:UvrD-helicase domain-containing protein [Bacteroidales bacterium]
MNDYLSQLNPQQREAVAYADGPQLIIAGAGSGKTRVLTYRIVHLLNQGYKPHQILALTFTNKAAKEMRERISALVGEEVASKLWMGTFHSIFARILRLNAQHLGYKSDYTIYDTYDSKSLIKHIIKEMALDDKVYKVSAMLHRISMMKNALFSPADYARNSDFMKEDVQNGRPRFAELYAKYWERCHIAGAMDFDDLLFNTNLLFRDHPDVLAQYQDFFKTILIDEYQDTNFSQDNIVYQLARNHQSIFAVGDDAQSIYSFRGANINNILTLTKRYPKLKIFRLEQNYRSTQNITLAANSLIEKNSAQIKKQLFSDNAVGSKIKVKQFLSDYDEAYYIANTIIGMKQRNGYRWSDFAVLYRTNAQSRIIERAFSSGGNKDTHGNTRMPIPYRIYGGTSFYERKEIKDAVCYLRLVLNPSDDEALHRIINYPKRGIGQTTVDKLQAVASGHGVSIWGVLTNPGLFGANFNKGTQKKLFDFRQLIQDLIAFNDTCDNAYEVVKEVIKRAELIAVLEGDSTPENISRVQNLEELAGSAQMFVDNQRESEGFGTSLAEFMTDIALATDQDKEADSTNSVTLMTVHAAKGLEFSNIIIFGAENDFFPSSKSQSSLPEIEEERRLFYVAITRAKENCIITHAASHTIAGKMSPANPSPFLNDIDPKFVERIGRPSLQQPTDEPKPSFRFVNQHATTSAPSEATAKVSAPPARFTPVAKAVVRSQATAAPAAVGQGDFITHTIDQLSVGQPIVHQRFGHGTIQQVNADSAGHNIIVKFENVGEKKLLLAFAKFKI